MIIETILGANRQEPHTKERACARGIVVKDDKILLSYLPESDFYMTPGGGLEDGETISACCIREIAEETGYIVKSRGDEPYFLLNEFYHEYKFINNFFICDLTGEQTEISLTATEIESKLTPKWIDLEDAFSIFSLYDSYSATNEDKRGSYLRDYTALLCARRLQII